jgi:hypothetical protein
MQAEKWSMTTLPGPRRFFARISDAVDEGQSVLVVIPHAAVDSGLAQQIYAGIKAARCIHVALDGLILEQCEGSIPSAAALAADFLEPLNDSPYTNRWQSYLHHEESGRKSVLVAGWDIDLTEDVSYWLRLVHASSLDPEDRPTFVFLVRDSDVNIEVLQKEHAPHLSVLWWWDVIGLLDSELCADLALTGQHVSPLRRAMLAESIGWELNLAEACARMWGSSDAPSVLSKALCEQAQGSAFLLDRSELSALQDHETGNSPPRALRGAWNDGNVNAWEGQILLSSRYSDFAQIVERRFWSAQARILMPYLEGQRQRMAKRFEKLASTREIEDACGGSGLLELGRMLHAHHRRRVDFGAKDETLLKMLVLARNKIAHHESLSDDLYAAIAEIYR